MAQCGQQAHPGRNVECLCSSSRPSHHHRVRRNTRCVKLCRVPAVSMGVIPYCASADITSYKHRMSVFDSNTRMHTTLSSVLIPLICACVAESLGIALAIELPALMDSARSRVKLITKTPQSYEFVCLGTSGTAIRGALIRPVDTPSIAANRAAVVDAMGRVSLDDIESRRVNDWLAFSNTSKLQCDPLLAASVSFESLIGRKITSREGRERGARSTESSLASESNEIIATTRMMFITPY